MHVTKPRPQLYHHDAQGCTFCTELIGGLVVMPCTTILRIWTPFLPCSLDHIVNSHRWVYSFWRVGTAATGKPRDFFLSGHHQSQHVQNFGLATFLKEPVRAGCRRGLNREMTCGLFKRKI